MKRNNLDHDHQHEEHQVLPVRSRSFLESDQQRILDVVQAERMPFLGFLLRKRLESQILDLLIKYFHFHSCEFLDIFNKPLTSITVQYGS